MKVLWFTNTPCGASEKLNKNSISGGWLISLEHAIIKQDDIYLFICFYNENNVKPFNYNKTTYFPIYRKNSGSKMGRYFNRILNRTYNDRNEVSQLFSVINSVKPDIIHIHGTEDNFGLLQKYTNVPVIISIQGILSSITEKYYSGIPQSVVFKCESLLTKLLKKSKNYTYSNYMAIARREKEILNLTKYIIGRTEWDQRVTSVLAPKSKYFFNNEILRSSFYVHEWCKVSFAMPLQLVTITGDELFKGFETIIKVSQILKQHSTLPFEWTIIGLSQNSGCVKIVEQWLKINTSNVHIKLTGQKNEKEVVEILLKSDIYCQVSHIENSPNSLCEAMLLGMPIISTFAGGASSLLTDKKEGIIVQDGEPYSFAGAILELANNLILATQYGKSARIRAVERHNKKRIIENLISIYKSILDQKE